MFKEVRWRNPWWYGSIFLQELVEVPTILGISYAQFWLVGASDILLYKLCYIFFYSIYRKLNHRSWYILVLLRCDVHRVQWASLRISSLSSVICGTHNRCSSVAWHRCGWHQLQTQFFFFFFVYSIMKFLLSYRMPNLLPSLQIQFQFDATKLCAHQSFSGLVLKRKEKIAMYKASLCIFPTQLVWWRGKKAVSKCSSSIWEIGWCSKPTFIIWTV